MDYCRGNVGLQRVQLKNLQPFMNKIFIVGVIIAKQKPKCFKDVKSAGNTQRCVWNFTLRDSPKDYINVTYWGSSDEVIPVADKFQISSVVEVVNPKIMVRKINDYGEQFRPMVTSPYSLTLNEGSDIFEYAGQTVMYKNLLKLPTKPIAGFVPLKQIHINGRRLKNEYVDVLGVLRGSRPPRNVSGPNYSFQVMEIEIFDCTAPSLKISLTDNENIIRATSWIPRCTVIFFTDLRVTWSDFDKAFTAKCTSRSIITENPVCKETTLLLNYAKNAPIDTYDILDQMITAIPEPNQIQDIMSVKQVQNKINFILQGLSQDTQFSALLYAFVTDMDLDGHNTVFIKCGMCRAQVGYGLSCENPQCDSIGIEQLSFDTNFDLRICVSDHTGTLLNCYFRGKAVENSFGCKVQDFLLMSDDQKRELKWQYILERCAIRIFVMINRGRPIISIVNISKENELSVAQKIPVY